MANINFWVYSTTGSDILVEDIGILVKNGAGNKRCLCHVLTADEIVDSTDLWGYVDAGDIVVNNGTDDLTPSEALEYAKTEDEHYHTTASLTDFDVPSPYDDNYLYYDEVSGKYKGKNFQEEVSQNQDVTDAKTHSEETSGNPHAVTKDDVGLGNVPNVDTTDAINNEHTHSNKTQLDLVTDGDHDVRNDNPHGVTKSQVGLGNVPNLDTTDAVNNEHEHSNKAQLDLVTDGDHDVRTDNPHSVTKTQVGLGNVTNVAQIPASQKGIANGVAELDGAGTVPLNQLPATVTGAVDYQGTWNASTNSPTLSSSGGGGTKGDYYVVSVAGTTTIDGENDWQVNDWIIHNGSVWEKVDNYDDTEIASGNMASVQARKSTAHAITTTSFADVSFDVTDTETDDTVIEHDDTNTERIKVKDTALYRISWESDIYISSTRTVTGRVLINGATQLTGSEGVFTDISGVADNWVNPCGRAVEKVLTANDYVTLQFKKDSTGGTHEARRAVLTVTRMQGVKGEKGDPGDGPGDGKVSITDTDETKDFLLDKVTGGDSIKVESVVPPTTTVSDALVMQYFCNEAASGTGPTQLLDSASDPLDLAIVRYDGDPYYFEDGTGRGLQWDTLNYDGMAWVNVDGTKIKDRIHGSKKVTIEAVMDIHNAHTYGTHLLHISSGSDWTLTVAAQPDSGNGRFDIVVNTDDCGHLDANLFSLGRFVFHMVIDTTQAVTNDRIKVYIDGVQQSWTVTTSFPSQDETIDLGAGKQFVIGNRYTGERSLDGKISYVAYYDDALDQDTITYHTNNLATDDDTSPLFVPDPYALQDEQLKISLDSHAEASDEGEDSTTSSTHTTKTTLNFTEATGAKWRIAWYCEMSNTSTGDMQGEVIVDDTDILGAWDMEQAEPNDWTPISGFAYYSAAVGTHKVDLDYWESAYATNKIRRARLEIWRMG